ncbi:amino acid ABC transporter permease, partial [Pseudomonas syringae pv. tagetis]
MMDFTLWDILRNLLIGLLWTVALSLVAFFVGGLSGLLVMGMRTSYLSGPRVTAKLF